MTKYVLNSGGLGDNTDSAKRFFAELVKGHGQNPRILMCFFAQPREEWEKRFGSYKKAFSKFMPEGIKPVYKMAFPESYQEQVAESDVIYCHGGDDHLAMYWFKKLGVPEVWKGKVVGTNSATTHALARHFWTCDWRQLNDGLGVLPIKVISHYKSNYGTEDPRGPIDWEKAKRDLETYGDTTLPVYALSEGEFIVFEDKL